MRLVFKSEYDPLTKEPIDLEYGCNDFEEVTGEVAENLVKLAVIKGIEKLIDKALMVKTSVKY